MNIALKQIKQLINPPEVSEGRGVRVNRIIGTSQLPAIDPFLMLDHAKVGKPNGFPPHPHRGFETITYIIKGTNWHEDFKGNFGTLNAGDVQWMTAGRGIVHVEMPQTDEVEGFQLWVNLKSSEKMCEPAYQEMKNETISKVLAEGVKVTIIAGNALGVVSPTRTRTPVIYLDVELQDSVEFEQDIERGWNSFIYVFEGAVRIGQQRVGTKKAAVLTTEQEKAVFKAEGNARFLLLAGRPIGETVVNHGPFVMNTQKEIQKCIHDYTRGVNGFEGAVGWEPRYITY
jgi:redox-sensitive bicupin YhaK (pirin superfamily)